MPIRETPPSPEELKLALDQYEGELKRLFNTSGKDYGTLDLKEQLPTFTAGQAITVLSGNGNLVKRPFAIDSGTDRVRVGFNADAWAEAFRR